MYDSGQMDYDGDQGSGMGGGMGGVDPSDIFRMFMGGGMGGMGGFGGMGGGGGGSQKYTFRFGWFIIFLITFAFFNWKILWLINSFIGNNYVIYYKFWNFWG